MSKTFLTILALVALLCLATNAAITVQMSPLNKYSNYVQVTVNGLPNNEQDGIDYEVTLDTVGFVSKQTFEYRSVESYFNSTGAWTASEFANLAKFDTKESIHSSFKIKFGKLPTNETLYNRRLILRFDIDSISSTTVSIAPKFRALKTNKSFGGDKYAFILQKPLARDLRVKLLDIDGGSKSDKAMQISLNLLESTPTEVSLYQYFSADYEIKKSGEKATTNCTLDGTDSAITGIFNNPTKEFPTFTLVFEGLKLSKGSNYTFTCGKDIIVHSPQTLLHLSEYWVAYAPSGDVVTSYVPGTNRIDKVFKYALIIAIVVSIVSLLIFIAILACICKCCNCCCFKKRSDESFYRRM